MKAIILAAGRGNRLGDLTSDRPKCMVEIMGRSLFSMLVDNLKRGGVKDIAVARGYQGHKIPTNGLHVFENPRWAETNMVQTLACASDWLRRFECLVSYGDIFYSSETVQRLAGLRALLAIAYVPNWLDIWARRFADPLADAESFTLDGQECLAEIGGRAESVTAIKGQYLGLLKFTPAGWTVVEQHIEQTEPAMRDKLDVTCLLSRLIKSGVKIAATPIEGSWGEVDSASDLSLYEDMIRNGELRLPT